MAKEIKSDLHRRVLENLKARRKALKMTQRSLADKLGMAPPSYCEIENGHFSPGLELIERLAKALDTDPSSFFTEPHTHHHAGAA